jgi:DNA mismatch endonuclease (patch repair protein)
LKVRPDVVFSRWRVAVFVDGCFWHGCPEHQRVPQRNREYWVPKLQANIDRDSRVDAARPEGGWDVVRVWEHEEVDVGTTRVVEALERRHRGTASASSCPPDRHTVAR